MPVTPEADRREAATCSESAYCVARVVTVTFGLILLLAAVSYSLIVHLVDWMTVGILAYPVDAIAPFIVITGAILTIPVVIPTVFVSLKLLR